MTSIVYQTDKRSGSTYAYRSEPTRDPKTGRPTQKRTYLGRVDPETGEIVPKAAKGKRNRTKIGDDSPREATTAAVASLKDENERLRAEVARLQSRVDELEGFVSRLMGACSDLLDTDVEP